MASRRGGRLALAFLAAISVIVLAGCYGGYRSYSFSTGYHGYYGKAHHHTSYHKSHGHKGHGHVSYGYSYSTYKPYGYRHRGHHGHHHRSCDY